MKIKFWSLFLVVFMILSACAPASSQDTGEETVGDSPSSSAPSESSEPVILRVGVTDIMDSINPHSFWGGWTLRWDWYDTLVDSMYAGTYTPGLAESWSVSDDGLVWMYKIREGVKFHDGSDLDAEGVAWSMNYMTQVENTSVAYLWNPDWTPIKEIKATDKYTLQITTSEPVGNMDYRLLYAYILPKSVWEPMQTPDEAKAFTDLIPACTGTGAFKCVEWVEGDHLIIDANPDHYRGKPTIDRIIFQQYASEDAMVEAMLAGEVDLIATGGNPVESLKADPNIAVDRVITNGWDQIVFNSTPRCEEGQTSTDEEPCGTQPASLADPIVREAMDYAVNRERIATIIYGGYAEPAGSVIPPLHGDYHDPSVTPTPFDIAKATKLLDDAGYVDSDGDGIREWSDGSPLSYRLMADQAAESARLVQLIQEDLSSVGIQVELELLSDPRGERGAPLWDFDLWYLAYGSDYDPDFPLITIRCSERIPWGWNYSGYCSEQGDANYLASVTTVDHAERVKVVHDAQKFIYEERPWLMLVYKDSVWASRKDRFTGFQSSDYLYVLSLMGVKPVK